MTTSEDEPLPYPFAGRRMELEPEYGQLRRRPGLAKVRMPYGDPSWLATRYDDVRTVLGDSRFSRAAAVGRATPGVRPDEVGSGGSGLIFMDPPEHTRLRRVLAGAFTARRVEAMRGYVEKTAAELVDRMILHGPPADLVAHLAVPLPLTVVCTLLGVPADDHPRFLPWVEARRSADIPPEQTRRVMSEFMAYMSGLVARRRVEPADDLLSELVQVRDAQGRLTDHELLSMAVTILAAGHQTTAVLITNAVHVLDRHRDH